MIRRSVRKTQSTVQVLFFFLGGATSQFSWPIAPLKMKLWRLLKIEGSVLVYIIPPFSRHICEKRTTFAKAYGIKERYLNGEHVGEHIGNPLGTQREHRGDTLGNRDK